MYQCSDGDLWAVRCQRDKRGSGRADGGSADKNGGGEDTDRRIEPVGVHQHRFSVGGQRENPGHGISIPAPGEKLRRG